MTVDKPGAGHHYINEFYTLREEVLNSVTHGIGTLLAIAALISLVILGASRGSGWHIAGFSIYGATLILLFLASTVYHGVQHTPFREVFRRIDHAAIYVFIAGCYTPFALIALRGPLGWTMLALIWGLAIAGILFKVWFINRWVVLSTLAYVGMGWLGIIAFPQLVHVLPLYGTVFLIIGGVIYTLGVIVYALERIPYNHAIWHVFILAAAACHFIAIFSLLNTT